MKSVLMIAYWFPPDGSAGVYRPLRFVRHLSKMGWSPTVLSADLAPHSWSRYDPELLHMVPPETEVVSVRSSDWWQAIQARRTARIQRNEGGYSGSLANGLFKTNRTTLWSKLRHSVRIGEAFCYHPDTEMGWINPGYEAGLKLCSQKNLDVIWATAGPVSSFVIAQKLSHTTRIPYVLDFRDAWTITFNEFEARRPKWIRRLDHTRMFRLLKEAQAVVFRYDTEAECFWRAYKGALQASRIHIIPNGYEGSIEQRDTTRGRRCEILYTGTIADYRYDTLLEALRYFKDMEPVLANQLHFRFIGEGADAFEHSVSALGLNDSVTVSSPVSHEEIQRLSQDAHALLVLGRPATMAGYELFAAAKLFGYLKAGRPIFGVLPEDETKKILCRVGAKTVASVDSVPEITAVLRQLIQTWADGSLSSLIPNKAACEAFSAERQTQELICGLEGTSPHSLFVPGKAEIPLSLAAEISERERALSMTLQASKKFFLRPEV